MKGGGRWRLSERARLSIQFRRGVSIQRCPGISVKTLPISGSRNWFIWDGASVDLAECGLLRVSVSPWFYDRSPCFLPGCRDHVFDDFVDVAGWGIADGTVDFFEVRHAALHVFEVLVVGDLEGDQFHL